MTSGSATLKNFSNWAVGGLKSNKKRQRSGSGGSKDMHCDNARKKSFLSKRRSNGSRNEQQHAAAANGGE